MSRRCELGAISDGKSASWNSWRNSSSIFQFFFADVSTKPQPVKLEHKLTDSSVVTVLRIGNTIIGVGKRAMSRVYLISRSHLLPAIIMGTGLGVFAFLPLRDDCWGD